MNSKPLIPVAGFWLASIGAAYYVGSSSPSTDTIVSTEVSAEKYGKQNSTAGNSFNVGNSSTSSDAVSPLSTRAIAPETSPQSSLLSIDQINQLTNPLDRSRHLIALIDTMSPADFTAALASFDNNNLSGQRSSEYALLLNAWGKVDPTGAIAYAQDSDNKEYATKEVLASWASNDTAAALKWARENHEGDSANPWLTGIIKGIVNSDPAQATAILQELPFSTERGAALNEIIPHIANLGVAEANRWLSGIADPKLRSGATKALAASLAAQDAKAASLWAAALTDEADRKVAVTNVITKWTQENPAEAKIWLESLTASDQAAVEPKFINSYAANDPNAAADWRDERVDSENYQDLLESFARGTINSDPILALNYGNELENERSRSRTVGRALWTLYREDQDSARNWIQNNELPDRIKRHVDRMTKDQ